MARNREFTDMSQLEREFELEMEDDDELEASGTDADELEALPEEGESVDDSELDDSAQESSDYANRFHELSLREFESESEVDGAVHEILNEMEQEFFFGKLRRGWAKFKKKGIGRLVNKALKYASGKIPAIQALKGVTQLARGDLKGMVGSLAKAGLGAAIPGGAVALDAVKNLGFESEVADDNKPAWENIVDLTRDAYEHLANNITENADQPLEASRIATDAFKTALQNQQSGAVARPGRSGTRRPGARKRRIRLQRGDVLIVHCD